MKYPPFTNPVQRALAIAQEIEHHQWMCLAQRYLAYIYLDLLMVPIAQQQMEQALVLATARRGA